MLMVNQPSIAEQIQIKIDLLTSGSYAENNEKFPTVAEKGVKAQD